MNINLFFIYLIKFKIYKMTFETFQQIIFLLKKNEARSNKLYKLGFDDLNMKDELHGVINLLFKAHYSEIGEDLISWWLYEDVEKIVYNEEDGIDSDLTEIEDLWKYVEKIRKSPDFVEYVPKKVKSLTKKQMEKMFKKMFEKDI